jgi:transposase
LIEACGAQLLYLPPYSPDLNPIEKVWSKFKQLLRSAKASAAEALDQAIAESLKTITPDNAAAWFRSCGYRDSCPAKSNRELANLPCAQRANSRSL